MRIQNVEAGETPFSLEVVWSDGTSSLVDLTGLVQTSRHFKVFARDGLAFREVRVVGYGTGVAWQNGLDCSMATLKRFEKSSPPLDVGSKSAERA